MGNICCGLGTYEMIQRQERLKEGHEFKKKKSYLGVLSKTEMVYVQLNPSATRILWRVTPGSNKMEEIPIFKIGKVCPSGGNEFVVLGTNGQKLLELTADTITTRDLWVQTLDELCSIEQASNNSVESKSLQAELSKQVEKQKEHYWKERTNEVEQRRLDAEERKKKIGVVGMKYTAQAMANR